MNLYTIRGTDGKAVKEAGFFASKMDAKIVRDQMNGGKPAELAKESKHAKFFITRGPDNIHYES